MDLSGVLFVADTVGGTIRKVATDGSVTTFAGLSSSAGGNWGNVDGLGTAARRGLAFDPVGNLYVSDSANFTVNKVSPSECGHGGHGQSGVSGTADGAGASALFLGPAGLCVDALGNIYVADTAASTIRKIFPDGTVTTLAGSAGVVGTSDGLGTAARFNAPTSLAVDRRESYSWPIHGITRFGRSSGRSCANDRRDHAHFYRSRMGANHGVGKAARLLDLAGWSLMRTEISLSRIQAMA
ncbi:MAG: hypothetical protein IPP19_16490 [Verrucomicrobia bacterium]|nr:hypothetical protein [Verrucomicrobiota bacterium]